MICRSLQEKATIEVWKGFDYRPIRKTIKMPRKSSKSVTLKLERTLDIAQRNWVSGDTHIHLNRRDKTEEAGALDLIEAEDICHRFLLGMNDTVTYTGTMDKQEWPQNLGMGRASIVEENGYSLSSGQEYRCLTYGHICLLMGDALVFNGDFLNPNDWPFFKDVAHETHRLNGLAIHAHVGYEQEIYADFIDVTTDGMELLQFAAYRGIGLEGLYHMLNAGHHFPALGGSDFPYCRALGDCRTYAYLPRGHSVEEWTQAVADGRSFFTTGPVLELSVNGAKPGDTIGTYGAEASVKVDIRVQSEVAPLDMVDIIVNGKIVKTIALESNTLPVNTSAKTIIPFSESMWVSARGHGEQLEGYPDTEAHTNPIYIIKDGKPIRHSESVE